MNMPYSAGVPYPTPPPEPYLAGRATANLPLPYGSQATQPPPGQFGSQSNLQPPARKNNTLLFALGGGVLTLVVIGLVLAVVLGGPKPNSATPTVVAIATATRQAEQPPTVSTTRAASTRQAIATTAAAANTVRSTPTPRPTTDPAASTESLKAPDGYLIFKNSDPTKLNLEIAHPKGWTPTLSDDGLEVDISDGTSSYTILREKTNTTSGTIEEYNARFVENLKKDGWVPKSEGTRYWGFAGEKWLQSSYQKGTNRAWGLFALHEGVPYAVVLTGEDSTFDDRLGNEFSQMFDNMHFLNTPINYFAGEMQSYSDPKGNFILNYPLDNWDLDKTSSPVTLNSKDQSQQFYIYTVTTSSLNTTDLLNLYKDKLANSGSYDDLKETERYKIVNLNNNNQEHYLRFSYSYKGKIYLGDLLIRKKSNQVYVGVALGNSAEELDSIYLNIWRYTNFLKG
jgi:hypothetical protein